MAEQRVIYIVIDPSKAKSGASSVVNSLRGIEGSTDRVNNRLRATDRAVQNLSRSFNRLQAIFIGMQGFRLFSGFLNELIEADKVVTTFKSQMYTVTGDLNDAADAFEHLKDTAQAYAVPLNSITKGYAKLRASMDFDHLRKYNEALFQSTVILSSVLHLPEYNTERVFNVMIQIMSKGQLMMEELKQQLGEHVPGAITLAAEAMGYTVEEMMELMKKGEITAEEFAAGWSEFIIDRFGPAVEIATKSIQASINRFKNVIQESMIEMSQSESGFAISKLILTIVSKIDSASEHFKVFGTQVAEVALDINDFVESLTPDDIDRFFKSMIDLVNAFISFLSFIGRTILFLTEYKEEVKLTAGVVFGSIVAVKAHNAALAIWSASVAHASSTVAMLGAALSSLLTVLSLAGAAFVGWSIGSWLYDEYDIVKKAGNRIALAVHWLVTKLAQNFEMMGLKIKLAVTQPFDYAMSRIAEFLRFLNSLGDGILDFIGIDYDSSDNLLNGLANYLDSGDAGDITRKLKELRQSHEDEIGRIIEIYDDLYDEIGKGEDGSESINDRLEIDEDLLAKYQEMRDYLQKLATDTGKFTSGVDDQAKALNDLRESIEDIRNELDPLGKEFEDTYKKIELLKSGVAFEIISPEERDKMIKGLVEKMAEASEDSAEAFINPWQSAADQVADSLQDAIASGDWDKLGDAIGNTLATSIAGIVNKTITDSLAKDLTSNSSALAQIGGAFAGPIGGAVAGGLIQGVMDSLLGSDPFIDPTEARQATQLTNTVLGSINDKSESIASASEITADNTGELINVNRELIGAIRGIDVASEALVEGISEVVRDFTSGGWLAYLGDAGFIVEGTLGDLGIQQYMEMGIFGKGDAIKVELPVDASISDALGAAVASTASLVIESVSSLGLGTEGLADRIGNIQVDFGKLSFEGMNSEEVEKEIVSLLSEIMDISALEVAPFVSDFQRLGEGAGETLVRLASQFTVFEESVESLSLSFSGNTISASDELVNLAGGLDEFRSSIVSFERNFLSDADQFANTSRRLSEAMGDLPLPETREGFLELARAQDLATAAGRENFATILELQGTADQYYSAIEKAQTSYYESEIAGQRERLSEAQRANQAVQSAMDSMLFQSSAVQEASRQSALQTLEQIASGGKVSNLAALESALDRATKIDQGNYSTFGDYAREFARTSGAISRVGEVTQTAEDKAARMLSSLESQLEAVKGLRDDLERSQLAIIKQTNKSAKALERIELDGIEVRE